MYKCFLCDEWAIAQRRIPVDAEYAPDDEDDGQVIVHSLEWLCEEHLERFDVREGNFNPYKYR